MNPKNLLYLFGCLLLLTLLSPAGAQQQQVVSADGFDYTGWSTGAAPMNAIWSANTGGVPSIVTNNPTLSSSYMSLNNGVIDASLSRTMTTDWTLSIDVLNTAYSRGQWVGVFNAAGTQGYGFVWNDCLATQYSSQGVVYITKYNVAGPSSLTFNVSTGVTQLTSNVASGHNPGNTTTAAISAPFAVFQLSWSAETHTLTLSVDGVQKASYTDTSSPYTTFSRVFVSGNASGLFDSLSVTTPGGAAVPFTTYEAEASTNTTTGSVVMMNYKPTSTQDTPEMEASGHGYVALTAQGQYLSMPVTNAANSIVVRHCIPDAAAGGGTTATLHLYVNGVSRQALTLSSYHNWLYGTAGTNGQSNSPSAGVPHVYWDETRYLISGAALNPGDTLKLQVDSGDTAAFYRIDCIDLETVSAALTQPANTYSVMSYGAYGDGVHDDTTAIQNCITAAQTAGKNVWMPTGTYNQSVMFTVNGIKIYGAGMWYTSLIGIVDGYQKVGFNLTGTGPEVHDMYIDDAAWAARDNYGIPFGGTPTNWVVQNVWITHSGGSAFWIGGTNGTISGCRVRFDYADGIDVVNGATNVTVTNCHVRGTGDDGIAVLSQNTFPNPSINNTVIYNTVIAPWNASHCDLAGGGGNVIEYNYFADSVSDGALIINMPSSYAMYPVTSATFTGNTIVRCGGNGSNQGRGAIWIYPGSTTIAATTFEGNYIANSIFRGIELAGSCNQAITFDNTTIVSPGMDGIDIISGVVGTGSFTNNTITGLSGSYKAYLNSSSTYTATGSGNNPTFP